MSRTRKVVELFEMIVIYCACIACVCVFFFFFRLHMSVCLFIFSAIDEIVLNYVLGIIECLDCHDVDETEDVEPFAEMMEAYLPGFGTISV